MKSPTASVKSKTARFSRNWLIFLLALYIFTRLEWPFAIRSNDWRVDEICGSVFLILLSIAVIWFGATRIRLIFQIPLACIGIVLLLPSIFVFMTLDLPLLFNKPNRYDFELLGSVSVGSNEYRLYNYSFGGFGAIPYTPFGFKFVKTTWVSTYYCCALQLQTSNGSRIEVLSKLDGKIVATFDQ